MRYSFHIYIYIYIYEWEREREREKHAHSYYQLFIRTISNFGRICEHQCRISRPILPFKKKEEKTERKGGKETFPTNWCYLTKMICLHFLVKWRKRVVEKLARYLLANNGSSMVTGKGQTLVKSAVRNPPILLSGADKVRKQPTTTTTAAAATTTTTIIIIKETQIPDTHKLAKIMYNMQIHGNLRPLQDGTLHTSQEIFSRLTYTEIHISTQMKNPSSRWALNIYWEYPM